MPKFEVCVFVEGVVNAIIESPNEELIHDKLESGEIDFHKWESMGHLLKDHEDRLRMDSVEIMEAED